MTITTSNAAPFSTEKHVNAAAKSLSPTDKKQLATVNAELARLNAIAGNFQPERMGQRHPLDEKIHEAEIALSENPSDELALALHSLIVRKSEVKLTSGTINGAIARKVRTEIDTLIPVAIGILDKAEESFLAEAQAHREATKTQTSFSTAQADFEARLEASRETFTAKRKWIETENAAAHFLFLELGLTA
jgi:hypothetical protein